MSEQYPADVEGACRAYLRAQTDVQAAFGTRIFFGVDDPSTYPVCTVQRIGGGPDGGTAEGLADVALMQFDVWGGVRDKAGTWTAAQLIIAAVQRLQRYTGFAGVILHGANVTSYTFLSDRDERARYSITAQVFAAGIG